MAPSPPPNLPKCLSIQALDENTSQCRNKTGDITPLVDNGCQLVIKERCESSSHNCSVTPQSLTCIQLLKQPSIYFKKICSVINCQKSRTEVLHF